MSLISCQKIRIAFGSHPLLQEETLQIKRGERIGLLGRNGEGKSTLLNIVAGVLRPDAGDVVCITGLKVRMLEQHVPSGLQATVARIMRDGALSMPAGGHEVERMCSLLELPPDQDFDTLSGGQKRRVMLGRALLDEPDVLLLDEPTNHLDITSIVWLESFLLRYSGSLLFVTHDRAFLQRLASRILELDRGRLTSWACDYPTYLRRKDELLRAEEGQWEQFDKKLAQEEAWIRQGIKARRTRNEGRVLALERLRVEREARRERGGQVRFSIQAAARTGRKVIVADRLSFAHGAPPGEIPVVRELTTTIMRGDKVGLIGPNGCGKTTLLNLLLGRIPPQSGSVEHGTQLQIAYFDQHRHQLDEAQSVFESVADGNDYVTVEGARRHVIGYLQDFLFSPDRIRQPVRSLSGGERNRLLLARLFTRASNVLVLDEPTNDLDAETLELLEERLLDYPGTILLVSHDRIFLDNICTNTLVFEGAGLVNGYVGGYSDWQACVARRSPGPEARPAAIPRARQPASRKLSMRERQELGALPERIEQLEAELSEWQSRMATPEFYRNDAGVLREMTRRTSELPDEIERAYARWDELEARR